MLYILKLVCLLQKNVKNGYVVYIKTSTICLLQKNVKNGYVVNIKSGMFTTVKTAMLYIRYHKISELSVE